MDDTDNSLEDIYKSAISAMRKEVQRLNKSLEYQNLSKKLEKRQQKIESLKTDLKALDQSINSSKFLISPALNKSHKHYSIKIDNTLILEDKIQKLHQKINREKSKQWKQEELFEQKMQNMDPCLYLTVVKLDRARKLNLNLRTQLKQLAEERKQLNFTYSRITTALRKEPNLSQRLEIIEDFERKIKDKQMSIKILNRMIEQFKVSMTKTDPEVQKLLEKAKEFQETLNENLKVKSGIQFAINKTCEEIEDRMKNPEKISIAAANLYCRQEIKQIQLDIAEKSKACKELEHEKLLLQMKYSESLKVKMAAMPKNKRKSLSNVNTHSSFATDKGSSRAGGSKTPGEFSVRQSNYVVSLLNKEKECMITKDIMKALDFFAPGQKLTAKIIAFNRSECSLSQRSFR